MFGESKMSKGKNTIFVKMLLMLFLNNSVSCKVIDFKDVEIETNKIFRSDENLFDKSSTFRPIFQSSTNFLLEKASKAQNVGVLDELVKTSGRMEWLVLLLADLKMMLNEAIKSQQQDLSIRSEVNELREEIKFLRDEFQVLKRARAKSETIQPNSNIKTKLDNEDKKIEWLTTGLKELRHELREVSTSFNITTFFHLTEEAQNEAKSTKRNLDTFQKDLEKIKATQAQTTEDIVEIRGDVADLNKKEVNLRSNLVKHRVPRSKSTFNFRSKFGQHGKRHAKRKIRSELIILSTTVDGLLSWTAELEQKLNHFESISTQSTTTSTPNVLDDNDYTRLITLETSLAETQNHFRELKPEIAAVGELRDSTRTLFNVLEALETKYDGHMTEFQEKLSHLDVLTSILSITQDEIKEQQTAQWKMGRKHKAQVENSEKRQAETHLRLTALQTQILEWGMKTCSNEMKETGQDLRITAIEKKLREKHLS